VTADERLALVQVKIERAKKHIVDLQTEIRTFFDSNPYEIRTKRDPQTRRLIYYLFRVEEIPYSIAAISGDILQNLRSALDHLAQQLWLVNNPGAISNGDVYFPTDSSATQFKANAPGKVKGLRQDAIDALYSAEPYDGGKGSDFSVINRLNRVDKHRILISALTQLQSINIGALGGAGVQKMWDKLQIKRTVPKMDLYLAPADTSALKAGSEIFIDLPDAEVNKDVDFRLSIALYEPGIIEGKPLIETVQHFTDLVSSTVLLFKPCLS